MHTKAVPRLGKPASKANPGQAWYACSPTRSPRSCEAPTLVTSLPAPSAPACPDLAQLLHTAVAQAFNAVVITNAAAGWRRAVHHLLQPGVLPHDGGTPSRSCWGARRACCKARNTDPQVLQRLRECLRSGTFFQGSTVNYRKDGSSYLVEWNISPVRDAQGQVQAYVSVQQDITTAGARPAAPGLAGTGAERHARCRADRR